MLLVIGTKNCSKCEMVKNILKSKNIDYQYKIIEECSQEERGYFIEIAKKANQIGFPIIIKDNKVVTMQEVC